MSTFKGTVNIVPNILLLQNLCLLVRYICSVTNTIVFLCKVSELREDSSSAVELGKAVSHEVAHSNSEKKTKKKEIFLVWGFWFSVAFGPYQECITVKR
jgi:hypothetical protein